MPEKRPTRMISRAKQRRKVDSLRGDRGQLRSQNIFVNLAGRSQKVRRKK